MKAIQLSITEEQAAKLRALLADELEGIMHRLMGNYVETAVADAADLRGMLRQVEEGLK